jgi:uncharacterized protein YoxC
MEKFTIGVIVGVIGGALLAANNYKMRTLIKKSQEEIQIKLDKLMDEKIQEMEESVETLKEKAEETTEKAKEKIEKGVGKVKEKVGEAMEKAKA